MPIHISDIVQFFNMFKLESDLCILLPSGEVFTVSASVMKWWYPALVPPGEPFRLRLRFIYLIK